MSPVALGLDLLLAALLVSALVVGARLNGRLKALRDSQANFVKAVSDLDQSAARAESALAALRAASEDTHDQILSRIETARGLITRLERASLDAERILASRPAPAAGSAPSAGASASRSLAAIAALAEGRASAARRAEPPTPPEPAPRPRSRGRSTFDDELFAPEDQLRSPLDLGPLRGRRKDDRR